MTDRTYPFLEGAFTPVTQEVTEFDLPVSGSIPPGLNGRLLRNGPDVLGLEDPRALHKMLGEGMVHGVRRQAPRARGDPKDTPQPAASPTSPDSTPRPNAGRWCAGRGTLSDSGRAGHERSEPEERGHGCEAGRC
nr:carotenoid oxygenase family protein [Streptomyces decoyicus]